MTITLLVGSALGWAGWCYWKRCDRLRREKQDSDYWDQVRKACPSCSVRRAERGRIC
jgi:hypothetical protein